MSGKGDNDLVAGFCWQGIREGAAAWKHSENPKRGVDGRLEGSGSYRNIQEAESEVITGILARALISCVTLSLLLILSAPFFSLFLSCAAFHQPLSVLISPCFLQFSLVLLQLWPLPTHSVQSKSHWSPISQWVGFL